MASSFEESYPNITHWVRLQGWIELGRDDYSSSLVRALDEGGMVWEGSAHFEPVDEALDDLESTLVHAQLGANVLAHGPVDGYVGAHADLEGPVALHEANRDRPQEPTSVS